MTVLAADNTAASCQEEFARRALELDLACWHSDTAGEITSNALCDYALLTPQLKQCITAAANACQTDGKIAQVTSGAVSDMWAFPFTKGTVIVEIPLAGCGLLSSQCVLDILKNYHRDLSRIDNDELSIDGFNRQLSQSYEEVNLIFQMAKLLGTNAAPQQVVELICEELRLTIGYGWLVARFAANDLVLDSLRGIVFHAGDILCPLENTLADYDFAEPAKVLVPDKHPLAAAMGSEVLAEPIMHGNTQVGVLLGGKHGVEDTDVNSAEMQLVEAAAGFLGLFHQNAFRFAQQREQFMGTLRALSAAVDAKDPYTQGHSERVSLVGAQLAAKLGLKTPDVDDVRVSGLLHDIGKIGVPEAILRKPGKLTDEEFAQIKQHPEIGHRILKHLPSIAPHLDGVLYHHERWDGRGYPQGLRGEAIPLIARILAFADTFDAMSSNRSYRASMSREHVLQEIRKSAGTQFDPALVDAFLSLDFVEFDRLLNASKTA